MASTSGGSRQSATPTGSRLWGVRNKEKTSIYTFFNNVVARLDWWGVEHGEEGMWPGPSEDLAKFHIIPPT